MTVLVRAWKMAPPHTRGWTPCARCWNGLREGSPAHAGMDPCRVPRQCRNEWLPRTRGDGPHTVGERLFVEKAPPHTRGWTHRLALGRRRGLGSPAHAGMDPSGWCASTAMGGLPRTRGDGPGRPSSSRAGPLAPPHTRGWTLRPRVQAGPDRGSPAHAGMDRAAARPRPSRAGLPRTRGDGPSASTMMRACAQAPPHTRGWTVAALSPMAPDGGSPAHAGMDPSTSATSRTATRLPRTRGDGPP